MEILAKVGAAFQRLFGPIADEAVAKTKVIQRRREFSPRSLAMTFVLGHLWKPNATADDLAVIAAKAGTAVTPQAVDQRRTQVLVDFLEEVFRGCVKTVVASSQSLAPLLERFSSVTVLDSTVLALPDSLRDKFTGCGGAYRPEQAAVKLQTELDLRSAALTHIEIEPGKSPDGATCRQHAQRGAGSLRITDLGYFNIVVFAAMAAALEFFLSRLQFGTGVLAVNGLPLDLLRWLSAQPRGFIDCPILLGLKERLPCRLIAWRVPAEQANRRRQKLREEMKRKAKPTPSAERLAWCDWMILVTNVPTDRLNPIEAAVLYRARWQIELLFKRWKSQGLVDELTGTNDVRTMIALWSRLIACVVQHWLLVGTTWADARISLHKVCEEIRDHLLLIAASVKRITNLPEVLSDLRETILKTCRRNKRTKPGTFELLNQPALLDFCLT